MTPKQVCLSFKKYIKKEWIICFASVLVFGLLTHMYKLTNTLPNWDSLNNVYSSQNTIHLGRCFLTLACGISSYYDLPWLNGLLSLFYLGISAVLVSEIFEIKKTFVLIMTGGILAAFPTVTSTFAYMYTADGYFLGMLCMTLAVFLTLRCQKGWIAGLFLLGFGYGCYQAYITWVLLLILFWSITQLLFTQLSVRNLLQKWGRFALCGILGTTLYFICNKALLAIQGISLSSYQGIGEMGVASFRPLTALRQCLIDFAYFFIGPLDGMNLYSWLNIILFLCIFAFSLIRIVHGRLYQNPVRFLLLLLCACAVPFAAYAIYFISPSTNYHMLMMMSHSLVYLYFLIFYEKAPDTAPGIRRQWLIAALSALIVYSFILTANICYQTMQRSYDRSYATLLRLADRIEQTDGTERCTRMTVLGQLPDSSALSLNLPPDMTGIIDGYLMSTPLHYQSMLAEYCGLHYELLSEAERDRLLESEAVRTLTAWPQENCITVIDDILVIRMGD